MTLLSTGHVFNGHWNICRHVLMAAGISPFHFVCSVSVDTECNKPRQTSRPFVRIKIQTSCNFEESLFGHYHFLDYVHCPGFSNHVLLEFSYLVVVWHHSCFTGFNDLDLLLY